MESSGRACGDDTIYLDGERLNAEWTGVQGVGDGFLAAYGYAHMSWTISCLYDSVPSDGSSSRGEDVVHVVALRLSDTNEMSQPPSFTISYRQTARPAIIRFTPTFTVPTASVKDYKTWSTPVGPFEISDRGSHPPGHSLASLHDGGPNDKQKSLMSNIIHVKAKIQHTFHEVVQSLKKLTCLKQAGSIDGLHHNVTRAPQVPSYEPISFDKLLEAPPKTADEEVAHDELDSSTGTVTSSTNVVDQTPSSVGQHSAAYTRSLDDLSVDHELAYNHSGVPSAVVMKSFFLALFVLSFLIWIYIWIRDPRRRADRAAKAEERRTKRLYRRAARYQKLKTWFWNTRVHYGLASTKALAVHEKIRRVSQQEDILEEAMKDDIRVLRNAHRMVSSLAITDAEEGRAGFHLFEEGGPSQRRSRSIRSVSTLPGYESDVSQPPPYDERRRDSVTEFTSDSSVVSTSPRISRDGTNSDYDEKIEDITLGEPRGIDV